MRSRHSAVAILLALLGAPADVPAGERDALPREFVRVLRRGQIPAIDNPRFVPAEKARIPDDAWVLGVEIDGEARAYSLHLLNQHEIVNDRIGSQPIAAVW